MSSPAAEIDNIQWADRLEALAQAGGSPFDILTAAVAGAEPWTDLPCATLRMPDWMAPLILRIFDGWSDPATTAILAAPAIRAWHRLDAAGWARVRRGIVTYLLEQALAAATLSQPVTAPAWWEEAQIACEEVLARLRLDDGADIDWAGEAVWASKAREAAWVAQADEPMAEAAEAASWAARAAETVAWSQTLSAPYWIAEALDANANAWRATARAAPEGEWSSEAWAAEAAWERLGRHLFALIQAESLDQGP